MGGYGEIENEIDNLDNLERLAHAVREFVCGGRVSSKLSHENK